MAVAPQNIMATLRSMPDAELAEYAAVHKNDPFIFPLAFQESQTRKQMRAAQQAQGGADAPKVADQAIAEMAMSEPLPEDVGIAQLPAQNMEGMAGGGIVAFDDGGEVPRFNGQTGSDVATSPAGEWWGGVTDWFGRVGDPNTNPRAHAAELRNQRARAEQGLFEALTPAQKAERQAQVAAIDAEIQALQDPKKAEAANYSSYKPNVAREDMRVVSRPGRYTEYKKGEVLPQSGQTVYAEKDGNMLSSTRQPGSSDKEWADEVARRGGLNMDPTGNIAGSRRTPKQLEEEAAAKAAAGKSRKDGSGITKLLPETQDKAKTKDKAPSTDASEKGLGSIAEFAKEANAYTGADPTARQLERIEKQEAGAAGEKKDALNMALLKAGLGMMAGTSQYAFENIGKGAMGGLEDYASAMKDLKKAALERDKMRDAAEQAAYAYKRDDVKGYRTAKENEENRRIEMEKAQLAARTQLQAAQTTAGAHLAAAQLPPKDAQMAALFGEGKTFEERYRSGLPKFLEMSSKTDPKTLYNTLLNTAIKNGDLSSVPSYPEYLKMLGYGGGSTQPGAGATIRANPALGG